MQSGGTKMTEIHASINGRPVTVEKGTTILDAAKQQQVEIPTLCYHPDLPATAACGICVVKVKGMNKMLRACCTPIEEGMEIITHDSEIVDVRRTVIELIISRHHDECLQCGRNNNCELQRFAAEFGIREERFDDIVPDIPRDDSTGAIVLDPQKCIKCGRCIEVCQEVQDIWALSFLGRGFDTRFAPAGDVSLMESPCVKCGQCSAHCPTGAIFEFDDTQKVWNALDDPKTYCVVQIAPAVRVALGEEFGYEPGTNLTKKIYTALRRLGFDAVFDTTFSADVTIVEEAAEFVSRFTKQSSRPLPLITTCCPSWIDYMEKFYPDMIPHFSTCKSPQQMLSSLAKTYYADQQKIDPKKMNVISIMPCTSKKYEISRTEEMFSSGYQDTDVVITTREFARMIKQSGIDFEHLPDSDADSLLGQYSGAGVIFGTTGGVMEAALRTAHYNITGENLHEIDFKQIRGLDGVKQTTVEIDGKKIRVAVAHGLGNVATVLNQVRNAKKNGEPVPFDFIEVMACPGGCIGGGGQPYGVTNEVRLKRANGLYSDDEQNKVRFSHENLMIKKLYKEFLGKPSSEKAVDLLHCHYVDRSKDMFG
jgi:NADP-reducing hydrogenase subunit HndD